MVKRYFTVDRSKTLKEGQAVHLVRYRDIEPSILQRHIDHLFPRGVTNHGERYMVCYYNLEELRKENRDNALIEIIFEYVRRSHFPQRPSRFQSVFGFDNINQTKVFRNKYGSPDSLIWEVQSHSSFKADMNLLTLRDSLLTVSYRAHQYWTGLAGGNTPNWEYLLVPPVKVIRKVS